MAIHLSRRSLIIGATAIPLGAAAVATSSTANAAESLGREDVLNRARHRIAMAPPYVSSNSSLSEGYRTDCSGFVAYAWASAAPGAATPAIGSSDGGFRINWDDLQPGDAVNNPNPGDLGHVIMFERWLDGRRDGFVGLEHAGGGAPRVKNHSRGALQGTYFAVRHGNVDIRKPYGLIAVKWGEGDNRRIVGEPTNDEFSTNPQGSGRFRDFERGMIIWKQGAPSAVMVHGAIFAHYRENGSETNFGFPLGDEQVEGAGRMQRFEHGVLHWAPERGVWRT
ncbi:LGFP repeat-containing protein [Demetria terragena]|uniref:LGFP repeat-containing protein n=1 Tax=Demetria terragena TaxID=63959 RepID=UPI000370851E|nr:hypothetical protein [Demetria terragena]